MKKRRAKDTPSHAVTASAESWRKIGEQFMALAREERVGATPDRFLSAHCNYKKHPVVLEKGKPDYGMYSMLNPPTTGLWIVGDGLSSNFQARCRSLMTKAGMDLGCPDGSDPEDFWLHRMYQKMLETNDDQLFATSDEGGMILRVCVTSATFCSLLERQALGTGTESPDRKTILDKMLTQAGFSIRDWAKRANVDFHTAQNYREGNTGRPYPDTIKKLADALGKTPEEMP
jgi:hypothetical protein